MKWSELDLEEKQMILLNTRNKVKFPLYNCLSFYLDKVINGEIERRNSHGHTTSQL